MPEPEPAGLPRFEVTSLGESMIRLSVGTGHRLANTRILDTAVAGAESNVCSALAGLGRRCGWVSRLPNNPLGQLALRRIRESGVDVSSVVMAEKGRIGTYFVELAAPPLPIRVLYDREDSAFTKLATDEVDWDYLLNTQILHLTGITPALSPASRELISEALVRAKERGVQVSFDVNYRALLWSEREAAEVLRPLLQNVDLLLCGKDDARRLFGVSDDEEQLLDELQQLTQAQHIAVTLDKDGVVARSGGQTLHHPAVPVSVVDRIGAGDAFAAGVLDGLLAGSLEEGLATGTALAALALTQHGDAVVADRKDVNAIVRGAGQEILR